MKIFSIKVFFITLILVQGCLKNDIQPIPKEEKEFTITTLYCTSSEPDREIPDIGSRVFIYYINMAEITDKDYIGNGKWKSQRDNTIISPDQEYRVSDIHGKVSITPLFTDRFITIVIESKYYTNRIISSAYENFERSIMVKAIFNP